MYPYTIACSSYIYVKVNKSRLSQKTESEHKLTKETPNHKKAYTWNMVASYRCSMKSKGIATAHTCCFRHVHILTCAQKGLLYILAETYRLAVQYLQGQCRQST